MSWACLYSLNTSDFKIEYISISTYASRKWDAKKQLDSAPEKPPEDPKNWHPEVLQMQRDAHKPDLSRGPQNRQVWETSCWGSENDCPKNLGIHYLQESSEYLTIITVSIIMNQMIYSQVFIWHHNHIKFIYHKHLFFLGIVHLQSYSVGTPSGGLPGRCRSWPTRPKGGTKWMGQFEQLSSCLDQARSDSPMKRWKDDVMFDDVLSPVTLW